MVNLDNLELQSKQKFSFSKYKDLLFFSFIAILIGMHFYLNQGVEGKKIGLSFSIYKNDNKVYSAPISFENNVLRVDYKGKDYKGDFKIRIEGFSSEKDFLVLNSDYKLEMDFDRYNFEFNEEPIYSFSLFYNDDYYENAMDYLVYKNRDAKFRTLCKTINRFNNKKYEIKGNVFDILKNKSSFLNILD